MKQNILGNMYRALLAFISLLFCTCLLAGELSYEDHCKLDSIFLEAIRLKHKQEHKQAFNTLQYALNIDSTSSAILYELSKYYLFFQKEDLALNALQKAVFHTPDNSEYKKALANLNRELGRDSAAIVVYEELIRENPQNSELYYYLSDLYVKQHHTDKAIEALNGLENNIGLDEIVSLQKCQLYKSTGKTKQAFKEIERLMEKFPTEAKYQILVGDFYLTENKTKKALLHYKNAAAIAPDNPYYLVAMSNYYAAKGDSEASIQEIEKALKNPSLDVETKLGVLGKYMENLHATQKENDVVNTLFETLMKQHSQERELNYIYGQFLLLQDKKEEAKFQFQIVTESIPENFDAWIQLLNITLLEENTDEIISICEKALIHFPNTPEFYFYKAAAYHKKNAYQNALDIYLEGIKTIPADNQSLLSTFSGQIGDLYYRLGNKEESFAFYEQAIKYNDKNISVLNNYAYYLSSIKENLDKAEKMAATVVQLEPDNSIYMDTYAWIFFQKENYSLAKFYIENAISKNDTPNSEIQEHYGDILYKTGNTDKAISEWEKALSLKEANNEKTDILKKKIADKTYYENAE